MVKKYDEMAEKIINDYSLNWEDKKQKVRIILDGFIKEITA